MAETTSARRPDGLTLVAIVHFVEAGLFMLLACFLAMIPFIVGTALRGEPDADVAIPIVSITMGILVFLFFVYGLANAVVGWGLWQRQPWARIGAIALSVLRLFSVPVGTIIGGLILWYLFQPEGQAAFER